MPAAWALPESSMRVFLTGATGVIGRRVLPLLVGLDHSVTAVAHRPQSWGEIERAGAVPVQVDLFARAAIQRAVAGHDAVINLATHLPAGFASFQAPGPRTIASGGSRQPTWWTQRSREAPRGSSRNRSPR